MIRWCMPGHLDCVHIARVSAFSGWLLPCWSMHTCTRGSVDWWLISHSSTSCSSASLSGARSLESSSLTISGHGLNSVHVSDHCVSCCLISQLLSVCSAIRSHTSTMWWWSLTMQHSWVLLCQWLTVRSLLSWMILLPVARSVCRIFFHTCYYLIVLSDSARSPGFKIMYRCVLGTVGYIV